MNKLELVPMMVVTCLSLSRQAGANNAVIDEVAWLHADPVTGSVTRTLKDGAIWYRTEYEPLGNQEISPYGNEIEFPEPQNGGTDGLKGAEDLHLTDLFLTYLFKTHSF